MTDQQEFDRLRQTCSDALKQLIFAAHETEFQMQQLSLPVSLEAARQFSAQRHAEAQSHEAYMVASGRLAAFVQQHLYIVN
jgi:hypothetical protein